MDTVAVTRDVREVSMQHLPEIRLMLEPHRGSASSKPNRPMPKPRPCKRVLCKPAAIRGPDGASRLNDRRGNDRRNEPGHPMLRRTGGPAAAPRRICAAAMPVPPTGRQHRLHG